MIRVFWLGLLCLVLPNVAAGEVVKGIYGVPSISQREPSSYVGELEKVGVNAVFVPADKETVAWFKDRGFQVFVSVNAFGGEGSWKSFPDSRPIKADGSLLGSGSGDKGHGGACPTHEGWRRERLKYVVQLVSEFGGERGIDGLWLDFIRYPGLWETAVPEIPDTCYCPRCLKKFQADSKIQMPKGLEGKDAAAWIRGNAPYEWMKWKKEQIASFVVAVKKILTENPGKRPLKLGLFLAPWTKGERGNAVSYLLGQDPFELAELVDVISPMVYHKMCGKSPKWVGYLCDYYKETVKCQVWPIVQVMDCSAGEFGEAVRWAWKGGAEGVLVYSFRGMRSADYADFTDYTDEKMIGLEGEAEIAVAAVDEWGSEWVVGLGDCVAGEEYEFRAEFFRDGWRNGVYPEVSFWGKRFRVDTHLKAKVFQPISVNVVCPDEVTDPYFRFMNRNRGTTFTLRGPSVKRKYRFRGEPGLVVERGFFKGDFFPIGVYGANLGNLEEIKRLAINTVMLGGHGEDLKKKIEKCHAVGLRYVVSAPHDPDRLPVYLEEISQYVRPYDLAFYVNDEPGIWSFPVNRANDMNRLIKDRFPGCATCMAVVRPQVCGDYGQAADFFMLDQYPVPFMPMTWLSDCMGECGRALSADYDPQITQITQIIMDKKGERRLAAVIQAFGGEKWKDLGWPRLPTEREMACLAFLSVVNGARGIFFFSYEIMGRAEEGREALGHVVGRLNQVYPWLVVENSAEKVEVEMLSENRFDPKGRAAVQCCLKRKGNEFMVIAVNTIGTGTECLLSADYADFRRLEKNKNEKMILKEVFSGEDYVIKGKKLRVRLGAYETKAFLSADYTDYGD